jgi:hypothetical protein
MDTSRGLRRLGSEATACSPRASPGRGRESLRSTTHFGQRSRTDPAQRRSRAIKVSRTIERIATLSIELTQCSAPALVLSLVKMFLE